MNFKNQDIEVTLPEKPVCSVCRKNLTPGKELLAVVLSVGPEPTPSAICVSCVQGAVKMYEFYRQVRAFTETFTSKKG